MHLDFWNNPLVVTALRIRYRRGGLMNLMTVYFLLLVTGGAVLYYYRDRVQGAFPRNYFLGMLALQILVSFMMASSTTSQSIRNEVVNRTFDFQRIANLSPVQILVGKLLGEPMLAYFSIIPTIPIAVYCCLILGVEGMDLANLLLVYATLLTTTIASGATGLLQPLEIDPSGKAKPNNNLGAVVMGLFFCSLPGLLGGGASILKTPWSGALLGLFTPIPIVLGIAEGNPWIHGMHFFGLQLPFLVLTPLSQMIMIGLIINAMTRRLVNPSRTLIGRPIAYLLLVVCDLCVAGVFLEAPSVGRGLYMKSGAFWFAHLLFALFLLNLVTPGRESLWSWSWRFRDRLPRGRDLLLGERSVNTMVLVIMALIGLADYFAMLVIPASAYFSQAELTAFMPDAVRIALCCTILFLSGGSLFQWIILAFDRSGRSLFFTLLVLLIVPVDLVGRYFQIEFLTMLSPSGHFGFWFKDEPSHGYLGMLALYSAILVVTQYWTHRRIAAMNRSVDTKLRSMKIEPRLLASGAAP